MTLELLRAPNPGPMTGSGTNTWVLGAGQSLVVDPGPDLLPHLERVARRAQDLGHLTAVVVTHHHLDHLEGAARLSAMTGAPIARHHLGAGGGELPLHDGDRILLGSAELEVLETPGHARDHICLELLGQRLLFSGDLVLQGTTSLVRPPDGDMAAYLQSLERLLERGPSRLLPGHGEALEDGREAISQLVRHRLAREDQILRQLERGPASPAELVPGLYPAHPETLRSAAAGTVHAHLLKLERERRVRRLPGADPPRFELTRS